MTIPFKNYFQTINPDGTQTDNGPPVTGWTITDGTSTVSNVETLTVSGGTVGGSGGEATLTITASGGAPASIPKFQSGGFYKTSACGNAGSDLITTTMLYYPMYIPNNVTVNTLSVNFTNINGAGSIRLALYSDDNGLPGQELYDSGTIAVNEAGVITQSGVATPLAAGIVWIGSGYIFNGGSNANIVWISNDPNAYGANPFDALVPSPSASAAFSFQNLGYASTDPVTLGETLPSPPSGLTNNQSVPPLLVVLGIG